MPWVDEPPASAGIVAGQCVLVGEERSHAGPRMAQERECEVLSRSGLAGEDLSQCTAADQPGAWVCGEERADQASRGRLGVAQPYEPVPMRDDLLGFQVRTAACCRQERKHRAAITGIDGAAQQTGNFPVLDCRGGCEPAGYRSKETTVKRVDDWKSLSATYKQALRTGCPDSKAQQPCGGLRVNSGLLAPASRAARRIRVGRAVSPDRIPIQSCSDSDSVSRLSLAESGKRSLPGDKTRASA